VLKPQDKPNFHGERQATTLQIQPLWASGKLVEEQQPGMNIIDAYSADRNPNPQKHFLNGG
jgi:hypothetical protein